MPQFEKSYFCKRFIDDSGLFPSNRRPVWYNEDAGFYGKSTKVFVSASWFPTWEEWKPRAEKAIEAASIQYDAFNGIYEKRGDGYPISGEPQYLLEKSDVWGSGYVTWVNALCPTRSEFERVKREAEQRIEDQGKPLAGMRIANLTAPLPLLPIPSSEFQTEPGTIADFYGL